MQNEIILHKLNLDIIESNNLNCLIEHDLLSIYTKFPKILLTDTDQISYYEYKTEKNIKIEYSDQKYYDIAQNYCINFNIYAKSFNKKIIIKEIRFYDFLSIEFNEKRLYTNGIKKNKNIFTQSSSYTQEHIKIKSYFIIANLNILLDISNSTNLLCFKTNELLEVKIQIK